MYTFVSIIIVLVCLLLILIVLVQNSKGGGLTAGFSSSNQVMGVRRTTDFLETATWTLAIALVVLSVAICFSFRDGQIQSSKLSDDLQNNTPEQIANPFAGEDLQSPLGEEQE